jgi:hypothetical protein
MGQRHQVHVAFRDYSMKSPRVKVVGLHHQWLYGRTAAAQAIRLMSLAKYAGKNLDLDGKPYESSNPFHTSKQVAETLRAVYSMIPEDGYYSRLDESSMLDAECKDPRLGDNNNGITVFDLVDLAHPAYCFMAVHDAMECVEGTYQPLVPMGVAKWLELHYPASPASKWQTYQRENEPHIGGVGISETLAECNELIAEASGFEVVRPERAAKIFPAMYRDGIVEDGTKPEEEPVEDRASKRDEAEAAFAAGADDETLALLGT